MEISVLIVTKNRPDELETTLKKLFKLLDFSVHEVLVFIDGCKKTKILIDYYPWVNWEFSEISISASPARNKLYEKAKGDFLIGLDDDAHPISSSFIKSIQAVFLENLNIGIIAFQEIRGVFLSDEDALKNAEQSLSIYETNDFVGCGFAIPKQIYEKTNGFPVWIDIYGEESCLAIEVIDLGYVIQYVNTIIVNHRVDREKRFQQGRNYFRFEKQLKNTFFFYIVYYPNPIFKLAKLLFHNFRKYGLYDFQYFKSFWRSFFSTAFGIKTVLRYRKPVQNCTLQKINIAKGLKY